MLLRTEHKYGQHRRIYALADHIRLHDVLASILKAGEIIHRIDSTPTSPTANEYSITTIVPKAN